MLQAQGVSYAYGQSEVIQGVDLRAAKGELLGVIGPNGSGKSTLLGILSGLLTPSQGRVTVAGREIGDYQRPELSRVMGLVPQAPQLAHGFTVLETVLSGRFVLMGRRMFEDDSDRLAAQEALDLTDLNHLAGRLAGELSGGERQRLAMARVLAVNPKMLLLDEPTSALDLDHQLRLMRLLERSCLEAGRTVCLVSHDLNLAALFCHRLVLLSKGKVLAQGHPREVMRPQVIKEAYGVETRISQEPCRGRPQLTLAP